MARTPTQFLPAGEYDPANFICYEESHSLYGILVPNGLVVLVPFEPGTAPIQVFDNWATFENEQRFNGVSFFVTGTREGLHRAGALRTDLPKSSEETGS